MTLAPGTKLGRYVVVEALEAGDMDEVYKVKAISQLNTLTS